MQYHDWCSALDDRKPNHISVAIADMSKAFDRMHPEKLAD